MRPLVLLALLSAYAPLCAQTGKLVSPESLASTEGNSYHWALFSYPQARFQQVERSLRGMPRILKSIAFRRDAAQAGGAARNVDADVWLAHGTLATFTNVFQNNFKDTPVAAFTKKTVSLPDWTTKPPTPPAPFNLVLPFDQPWSYNGQDDVLISTSYGPGRYDSRYEEEGHDYPIDHVRFTEQRNLPAHALHRPNDAGSLCIEGNCCVLVRIARSPRVNGDAL